MSVVRAKAVYAGAARAGVVSARTGVEGMCVLELRD